MKENEEMTAKQSPDTVDRLVSTLGLCRRAKGLVLGTPMVCEAIRDPKNPPLAVIEASDTSDGTHDKLISKCRYYRIPHYRIPVTTELLGHTVGKSGAVAAVGVIHEGLFTSLKKYLPEPSPLFEEHNHS